jgi:putative oxidoreductase
MFPELARFTDLGLLLLRLMVGLVFVTSSYRHLKDPAARAKDIGMSTGFTIFLGIAEVAGGLGIAFGVLTQLAAFGLILIMLGAIQKKIFSLAYRLLGRQSLRLALRPDVDPDEPGNRIHRRWRLRAEAIRIPLRLLPFENLFYAQTTSGVWIRAQSMHRLTARLLLLFAFVGHLAPDACCLRKTVHHCHSSLTSEFLQLASGDGSCCTHDCCHAVTRARWAYAQPPAAVSAEPVVSPCLTRYSTASPSADAASFQSTRAPPNFSIA